MPPKVEADKARRALNRSKDEETVLVNAILPVYDKLFGAHSKVVTEIQKKALWNAAETTVCVCLSN